MSWSLEWVSIKFYGVAPLVADPPPAKSNTDTDTNLLSDIGHTVVDQGFGHMEKFSHRYWYTPWGNIFGCIDNIWEEKDSVNE